MIRSNEISPTIDKIKLRFLKIILNNKIMIKRDPILYSMPDEIFKSFPYDFIVHPWLRTCVLEKKKKNLTFAHGSLAKIR